MGKLERNSIFAMGQAAFGPFKEFFMRVLILQRALIYLFTRQFLAAYLYISICQNLRFTFSRILPSVDRRPVVTLSLSLSGHPLKKKIIKNFLKSEFCNRHNLKWHFFLSTFLSLLKLIERFKYCNYSINWTYQHSFCSSYFSVSGKENIRFSILQNVFNQNESNTIIDKSQDLSHTHLN